MRYKGSQYILILYFCTLKRACFIVTMNIFNKIKDFFFPDKSRRSGLLLLFLLLFFKILWFDFSWCLISTFRPFSYLETYLLGAVTALILLWPAAVFRMTKITVILAVILGCLLLSNLIYFRTYYTAIPLSSYGLLGNMSGYTSSIFSSLRWTDALFPISTLIAVFMLNKRKDNIPAPSGTKFFGYLLLLFLMICISGGFVVLKGSFKKSYEKLQDSYTHTCGPVIYTVFGSVYYDYIRDKEIFTSGIGDHIKQWMELREAENTERQKIEDVGTSCIVILAESLESWVLENTIDNQEITPYLNRLLKDSSTLYAPHVLSQAKGGRSIDAQLMINTGLLPINTGVYSLKYPYSQYPSLPKAMKAKYAGKSKSFILTADKPTTWNQSVIAASFGFDTLISKSGFIQDEKVGPHYRHQLGDISLLRQCAQKITSGETWTDGANIVQIVTYSGHFPFTLPENLRELACPDDFPEMLCDYMAVARYTDKAIGQFVEEIRNNPQYDNTLIVITGDHEGLADMRNDWYNTKKGRELVSPKPFVPLIIVNAPLSPRSQLIQNEVLDSASICMRYNRVMGQIDIYPTLLDLLGLSNYAWKGLGMSILNPNKRPVACDPYGKIYGDTTNLQPAEAQQLKDAWIVSDEIIKYDYFQKITP